MSALHLDGPQVGVKVGSQAPDFTLTTDTREEWRLSDHLGVVTVLLFYPQNETVVCTKQLCSVRDNWSNYLETKATIVGISPGTTDQHRQFAQLRHLPIPLLADPDRRITRIFSRHWLFPTRITRSVVVIDAKGVVRSKDIMLRAFRPSDEKIITDIYAARGDDLTEKYHELKARIQKTIG